MIQVKPRAVAQRSGIGAAAFLVQDQRLLTRRLRSDSPAIVLVLDGRKIVRSPTLDMIVKAGEAVAIGPGWDFDVINEPDGDRPYRAQSIWFSPQLLGSRELAGLRGTDPAPIEHLASLDRVSSDFLGAWDRAVEALERSDLSDAIAAHRVREVLVWLELAGFVFRPAKRGGIVERIRELIGQDVGAPWSARDVAAAMAMSEATLRRRLQGCGTTLTDVVTDVRMSTALMLLQSTDRPVTTIAGDVGYDSPSRFAARFRARFGFSPSAIRSRRRGVDRIGTEFEQARAARRVAA